MPRKTRELSRFTNSGKTFFFNLGQASNGTEYLAVNTIYGRGSKERVVLFPSHLFTFQKHLREAIEEIHGVTFNEAGGRARASEPNLPQACPACEYGWDAFRITPSREVFCDNCGHVICEEA